MKIKSRLKELRKNAKLTQVDLANFLGVTTPTYSRYESGFFKLDAYILCKLAEYYNVSIDYILLRTDDSRMYKTESEDFLKFVVKYDRLNDSGKDIVAAVVQAIEQKGI